MKKKHIILGTALLLSLLTGYAASPVKNNNSNKPALQAAPVTQVVKAAPVAPVATPVATTPAITKHMWNLQGVDIKQVVTEISRETGKNFILDPQVQGKVTIISSHPMGPQESYQVFLSTLRVLGYAVVPDGVDLKIVPSRDATNQALLATAQNPGQGDQVVVRAISLRYVSAMQLIPALRPLLPTWGNVSAYSPSNTVIVSGTAENVQRIDQIIQEVDTPAANGIDVVRLQHAVADDLVKELNKLILAARANGAGTSATLSADEQSNSILISGDRTSRVRLKVLIAKIDGEDASGNNNTQVIYLKYIQVKDILPILKGMVHQSVSYSMSSGGGGGSSSYGSSDSSGGSGSSLGQASPQFQAAASSQINNATLNSDSGGASDKSKTTIVGDVTNNALVITADPTTMMRLHDVINALDVAPKQVLVQGVIAEVDAQTAQEIGIQWGTGGTGQSGMGVSGAASAYSFGGGGMGVGFLKSGDMRALIALLSTDTNSNIVSTPSITVLNNSPADIEVGKNIYETTGSYQPGSGSQEQQPYNTFSEKQVGLTLKVIPQITGSGAVRLIIDQQNSSEVDDAQVTEASPNKPTTEEKINTQVMVNDGQVLVLGGLINSQDSQVVNKVPILGDIPVLGRLFQSRGTQTTKKDLMIFLRPVIIQNNSQLDNLTKNRYDFMRDVAILNGNHMGNLIAQSKLPSRQPAALPSPFSG
jgi:general secretion pathway protein D